MAEQQNSPMVSISTHTPGHEWQMIVFFTLRNEAQTCGDAQIKETGTQTNTADTVPVYNTHPSIISILLLQILKETYFELEFPDDFIWANQVCVCVCVRVFMCEWGEK